MDAAATTAVMDGCGGDGGGDGWMRGGWTRRRRRWMDARRMDAATAADVGSRFFFPLYS
jgi:hypothetical protein